MGVSDTPIRRLFIEMRRRRIFRTAALYIVGTWLVMQVADVVFPAMDIPDRAIRYVLVAALLGFPAAMIFGWFYDVGVHGIRRTGPAEADDITGARPLRRSDYVILTVFAGVVALILYNAVENVVEAPRQVQQVAREGPPMLAVLPFTAASNEGDSAFFAYGVHDDLLTQLAQLQSIRVISRTSVLEYRHTVRNMREIGAALGADAILEGGVQSSGDQIRINVQLIDARTDEHLWAQTYDRELSPTNIFDVQTEIARAITSAMQATLTEQDAIQLTVIPTENMAAYRAYHRALELRDTTFVYSNPAYRLALEEAVALDPTFTRAWAELVGILTFANYFVEVDPELIQRAEEILEKIRILAPNSADYLIAQTFYMYYTLKDYDRALQFVTQAQEMMPSDARILELKWFIQRRQGDIESGIETIRQARTLDPRDPRWTIGLVTNLMMSHQYEDAGAEIENSAFQEYELSYWQNMLQLREYRNLGRWADAVTALHNEYEGAAEPLHFWEAQIANREYEAAEKASVGLPERMPGARAYLSQKIVAQIITHWFSVQGDRLTELLVAARTMLEEARDSDGNILHNDVNLDLALVAATEGNTEETERLIRRWQRGATEDLAGLGGLTHFACQILGMAGATEAAVVCIRAALVERSLAFPYLEPFLPYYDSVRDDPLFVELLAEIDAAAGNP